MGSWRVTLGRQGIQGDGEFWGRVWWLMEIDPCYFLNECVNTMEYTDLKKKKATKAVCESTMREGETIKLKSRDPASWLPTRMW